MMLPDCTTEEKAANVDAFILGVTKDIVKCADDGSCAADGGERKCGTQIIADTRIEGCVLSAMCGKGLASDEANPEGLLLGDGRKMSFQCGHGLRLIASAASIFASVALAM